MRPAAALGFRVKSGWATAVLLVGPKTAPRVVERRFVELADPAVPAARQPYHAGIGRHEARRQAEVKRLVKGVERYARRSLGALIAAYRAAGHRIRGVGIVAGSTIDPARIPNDHIRAHAEEGRLFRSVIEAVARAAKLRARVMVEKEIYAHAAKTLGIPAPRLKARVGALGEAVDGPWRAEEKAAALAAWMVLR